MILPNSLLPIKNKGFTLISRLVKSKSSGFTLIELLVVIAIIGILLSLGLAGFQRAQMNARDARRIQDMDQVKIALEMYFETNLEYPTSDLGRIECESQTKIIAWGNLFECDSQIFMRTLPENPGGGPEYCYAASAVAPATTYTLYAQMENDNNANLTSEVTNPGSCTGTYDYQLDSEV